VTAFVTNKTPSNAYRGYGVPEAVFALERLVEKAAGEVGVDSLEARRRMLIENADLPYTTAGGGIIDSGSFREAFDRAVELGIDAKERASRASQHLSGMAAGSASGLATYREGTAATHFTMSGTWTGQEACSMGVEPDGSVIVSVGMADQG
jgi:carbon-monoxide dehydrogenase large subunit